METGLIDFNKIKEFLGEDKDMLISFYDLFKEQSKEDNIILEKSINEMDWSETAGIAHKMKSFFGNIGSAEVYDLLVNIEKNSKESPEFNKLLELFKKYLDLYSIIIVEFDKYLSQ
jgi:hypothetical protein